MRRRRFGSERGSMAVEVVILVPVLLMFVMLIVACGRYVAIRGDIEAAARDAARAASLERSVGAAGSAADSTVAASLKDDTNCRPAQLSGEWQAGGTVTISLDCEVSYDGLGLIGLPGSVRIDADSSAPLDPYKRYE